MENTPKDLTEELSHEFEDLSDSHITEEILKKCCGYGPFQKKLTLFVLIYAIFDGLSILTLVFIREPIAFGCYPTNFNKSLIPPNIALDEFLDNITVEEDKCSVYDLDIEGSFYALPTSNMTKGPCSNGRKFYTKFGLSSIMSEFDLVCEREWMNNFAISAMFGGVLVGCSVFGLVSDKFGRFKTFLIGEIVFMCALLIRIHSPNYAVFAIMYFMEGFGEAGTYPIIYTLLLECVTKNYRMPLNFVIHGFFALGEMLVSGMAYVFREWKDLLFVTGFPHILLFIIALIYLPESPRWQLNKGRFEEAEKTFNKIARTNKRGTVNTGHILHELQRESESKITFNVEVMENINVEKKGKLKLKKKSHTAIGLLKKPRRAIISAIIWFNWFVNSIIYYGVTLNSVDMSGNQYINYLMMVVIEIPASIIGYLTFRWFGHRTPIVFFMVFGGINCIVSNFVPKANSWFPLILAVLGKMGATASFGGIYLASTEVFPTVVRNSGVGTSSSFARLGSLTAPLILELTVFGSWLPLTVYGVLGILGGLLIFLLPDMKDTCLPQTFEDMDNL
ncbi:organic cation transporter protein isoform X1 [Octopus bimaculoides]|uniref:Major facilitator superfamily (MFS) profile domain-containing protein n=1 Tax=Octopus bimaculoides TaxID=37653 RepID=A0A0L8FVU3_OCTBM|nr:organic cation transporter protein isoform X1 [Octopus bimaculoides]XP_052828496.1 organic cation transporter protein isoform X1 [Octopus bimaculoides]XP_052828497.1 organic cation transporter protein isoform X1 [Octopus bimaculoides]|eukprot:XP_014786483.1 PREDICTED: organic cation transporter protein-like isoform X1 [Octopus bimaculoides]